MFNIASCLAREAATHDGNTPEARTVSLQGFKHAAGWYNRVRTLIKTSTFVSDHVDLKDLTLMALEKLCLALSQFNFLQIVCSVCFLFFYYWNSQTILKNMKPVSISKIAQLCSQMFHTCVEILQKARVDKVESVCLYFYFI